MAELDLRALQERFFELVTAREDVPGALARLGHAPDWPAAFLLGDQRLGPTGRLDIYNNMYFFRLLEVVRDDFPVLAAVLGTRGFRDLGADYLEAHPPRDHSLRDLAAALPGFVAQHHVSRARTWLPALAAFEWARADVHDRADARLLTRADLATLPPEGFATLRLLAVPAATHVDADVAVDELWGRISGDPALRAGGDDDQEAGALDVAPAPAPGLRLVVWRAGVRVRHRRARAVEQAFLPQVLGPGLAFGQLCEALAASNSDEVAAQAALGLLVAWIDEGLLRGPAP